MDNILGCLLECSLHRNGSIEAIKDFDGAKYSGWKICNKLQYQQWSFEEILTEMRLNYEE